MSWGDKECTHRSWIFFLYFLVVLTFFATGVRTLLRANTQNRACKFSSVHTSSLHQLTSLPCPFSQSSLSNRVVRLLTLSVGGRTIFASGSSTHFCGSYIFRSAWRMAKRSFKIFYVMIDFDEDLEVLWVSIYGWRFHISVSLLHFAYRICHSEFLIGSVLFI